MLIRLLLAAVVASSPVSVLAQAEGEDEESEAASTGKHCANGPDAGFVAQQLLVGQINPGGVELSGRIGYCAPLITGEGLLFDLTHIEGGVYHYLTPAFGAIGGYVQVTPLSLLVLRAEIGPVAYWPFPFDRAGYFPLTSYDDDFREDTLVQGLAETAGGFNLNLIAILRAKVGLAEGLSLIVLNLFDVEHWNIGNAPFYFNLRRDLVLAQSDWLMANEAFVGVEIAVTDAFGLRFGAFDSLKYVFESGYTNNQAGIFAMGFWPEPSGVLRDLMPFVRFGIHTNHAFRDGQFGLLGGVSVTYDL